MSDKWLVVPYGNAIVNGEPESEWDWMVNHADDTESIEVDSKERAEQIAALLNADDQPKIPCVDRIAALEEALRGLRTPYEATWSDDLRDLDPRIQTLLNAVRVAYDVTTPQVEADLPQRSTSNTAFYQPEEEK